MVDFAGRVAESIRTAIPASRPTWVSLYPSFTTDATAQEVSAPSSSAATRNTPVSLQTEMHSGHAGASYSDIFYNRILISPVNIDLGNISTDQAIQISVFNAYFSDRTLNNISFTPQEDITIDGPASPIVIQQLGEIFYTVNIAGLGSPQINASFVFQFLGADPDVPVTFTGSRITTFPYIFQPTMQETLAWNTQIFTSINGTEQRVKLRDKPRQSFSGDISLISNEISRASNLFYANRHRSWAVPIWSESVGGVSVSANDITINLDTRYSDFRANSLGIIWLNSRTFDIVEISAVTSTSITLARAVGRVYGSAIIAPVRTCDMISNPTRNSTGHNGGIQYAFEVIDNAELAAQASAQQFNNTDVFLEEPLLAGDAVNDQYIRAINTVGFNTGIVSRNSYWSNTKIDRQFNLLLEGLENIWSFRLWLHRRSGRLRPFYMPSFENDLRLIQDTGALTTSLEVRSDSISNFVDSRDNIAIRTTSNNWLFRAVNTYQVNAEGNTTVTFSAPLNIDASEVDVVSFMGLKRLNSDNITLNWIGNDVVETTIPILEIEP